ncbi:MAG: hypothetical protein GX095_01505 [Clostridiales bacterium]|jgi:hypothetical protein|nr:hypothetical protein [Clostridiales bacterium]HOB64367.1 hypothetical protein [Clostridia bacterium]HOK81653.1 hypothetical protein [Clostridia bacterium]HOL60550.1 hypothetical protein [Clostridia bacterium]HPO52957.1 hypothetical protein [Clostridia bacterium]
MNYRKDPIYKALSKYKPDKRRTLEAAYALISLNKKKRSFVFKAKYSGNITYILK